MPYLYWHIAVHSIQCLFEDTVPEFPVLNGQDTGVLWQKKGITE
jgi:hypothetical protein